MSIVHSIFDIVIFICNFYVKHRESVGQTSARQAEDLGSYQRPGFLSKAWVPIKGLGSYQRPGFLSKRASYFLFFLLRSFFTATNGEALEGPILTGFAQFNNCDLKCDITMKKIKLLYIFQYIFTYIYLHSFISMHLLKAACC